MSTVSQGPGGSALNTAWHLAAQDVPTSLYAAVGNDRMAQVLTHALRAESKVLAADDTLARTPSMSPLSPFHHFTISPSIHPRHSS